MTVNINIPGFGKKRTVNIDGEDVVLDPSNLTFNDATLNQFFELVSGFIDYYGQKLADANRLVARSEANYERLYIEKFRQFREGVGGESGKSEKTSELYAKAEPEVVQAKQQLHENQYKRDSIWNHLKAMNAAREDAYNRGHFLRKEMDKLNADIRLPDSQMGEWGGPQPTQTVHRGSSGFNRVDPSMEDLFEQHMATKKKGGE